MTRSQIEKPLQVFIIDYLLMFVNQTQVGADFKVPFAVRRHKSS